MRQNPRIDVGRRMTRDLQHIGHPENPYLALHFGIPMGRPFGRSRCRKRPIDWFHFRRLRFIAQDFLCSSN